MAIQRRLAFLGPWLDIVPENMRGIVFTEIERRINIIAREKGFFRLSVPFVIIEAESIKSSGI